MPSGMRTLTLTLLLAFAVHADKPERAKKLCGIRWQPSLQAAQKAAAGKDPKPVLFLRVLGDLAGKT